VKADPARLAQVFANLLNNAAKYTPDGGRIRLSIAEEDGNAVVRIRDTGSGIPAEMLSKIFDLFTQVNNSLDRSQGGLGIGLTLVHRLVEMHDGTVQAFSDGSGQGSEFVVRLPLHVEEPALQPLDAPEPIEPAATAACRVLVVDDNVDAADTLAMLLRVGDHEVRLVHDGLSAVDAARAFRPHVVLLDIGLPGLNGYEVARRLRDDPITKDVLLVAVSGYGQDDDRRRSQQSGFDHHLVKPVDLTALQRIMPTVVCVT
jgi:CheY-like chemotaxis protein